MNHFPCLLVGLGNPGPDYAETRHNIGFMVVDSIRSIRPPVEVNPVHTADSLLWSFRAHGKDVLLQKPLTFMNESGKAVLKLTRTRDIIPPQILLIYDDVDLPLGRLRIRRKGGSGGHRGVESIIAALQNSEINRIRVGIGRGSQGKPGTVGHVLSRFVDNERACLESVVAAAARAALLCVDRGVDESMNAYNGYTDNSIEAKPY